MAIAVCYETPLRFARYTIANGSAIPKGTLLKLVTPNTCDATSADNDVAGGVAWMEKVASDGTTEIVAALDGVWGITGSGVITIGNEVVINAANQVTKYTTLDHEKGYVFGRALETTLDGLTVLKVRLNVL